MAMSVREREGSDLAFGKRLLADAASLLLKALFATTRAEIVGFEAVKARHAAGQRVIFALWHGRLLIPLSACGRMGIVVLVSRHGDGGLIARALSRFGFSTVRGSTTRGGASALREMLRVTASGRDVAITPDGPRGPRGRAQMGVVFTARETGLPIFPVGIAASRFRELSTWDRFQVPKPFARIRCVFGPPVEVPRDIGEEGLEEYRLRVENALHEATAEAERRAGLAPCASERR
jgi:lysophospholipid acyltransferase (LPLAT)-like uncharacterized protein